MAKDNHKGGIGFYVFVVLVLAVITYVEFAIVEYDISWLNKGWTLALLAILSLVKFFMVIWFFMHLKDDNKTYTGFFSSGMIIAMGTFIALAALFTARSAMNVRAQQQSEETALHGEAEAGHSAEVEIPERAFADTLRVPQPKNQGLSVDVPKAAENTFSLNGIPAFGLVNDSTPSNETAPANETTEPAAPEEETTEPESSAPAEESNVEANSGTEETSSEDTTTPATTATEEDSSTLSTTDESASAEPAATDTTEATSTPTLTAQATIEWDRELGEKTYNNCVACHQPNGKGVPSAFPPQAGHAAEIYNLEGGRTYMIHTVLWGLQGEIKVDGKTYNGIMTPWGALLEDEQIAAVLNHVLTSWGNDALLEDFTPITAEEVAAERANTMTAQEVYESRAALNIPE